MAIPSKTQAIVVHAFGGPEVLRVEDVDLGAPGAGEVVLRHTAIGLNMSDCYRRKGVYKIALPSVLGIEGAGVVEAVGASVTSLAVGDRVAYGGPLGSYSRLRKVAADKVVKIPAGISDQAAAAIMLKGLTVHYLLYWTYAVKPGDFVLFHAAAGGVGLIFCQWARHIGATVIGTVSTPEKAELAKAHGCHHVLPYQGFAQKVAEITGGKGCAAVYDAVGKDTILDSITCLRPRGVLANFGAASGPVPALDTSLLQGRSLFFTRPGLGDHTATRADLETGTNRLFDLVQRGVVKIEVNQTFALKDVADAHRALEGRKTTGSTVLVP
jgi:NADPH2:quinone reductase